MPDRNGWISVNERLPEINNKYLVFFPEQDIPMDEKTRKHESHGLWKWGFLERIDIVAYRTDDGWLLDPDDKKFGKQISHWQPLPQRPEGEEIDAR